MCECECSLCGFLWIRTSGGKDCARARVCVSCLETNSVLVEDAVLEEERQMFELIVGTLFLEHET